MSVKRLVPGSDNVLTQDTDFSRDVPGRYVCNNFTEAEASTDPNPRPDVGRNDARSDARPFDIIVIGGGTFGAVIASLYSKPARSFFPSTFRIFLLSDSP